MNTYNLTLDLAKAKQRQQQTIFLRQGDRNATTIVATITDHGVAASTSGLTARFQMRLPDGTHYYRKAASLSGNTVTVTLDEAQAASAVGRTDVAYFQLLQGSTVVASTESFTVVVLPDALADAEVAESYDSAIQDAIDALDAAVADMPDMVEDVLEAHPEWTTTVTDGSITKDKLATDLARDRERLLYRLDNMLTNALPEGDVATATDAAKTPAAGLALYGRSTQDGTPTPSAPVPIVSVMGQLYSWQGMPNRTTSGITWTINADGSIHAKGTATEISYGVVISATTQGSPNRPLLPAGTYTASSPDGATFDVEAMPVGGTNARVRGFGTAPATFTLAEPSYVFLGVRVASGTVVDADYHIALYAGSTAYPYVPYGNAGLWAKRTSDASTTTATPIDLDGHELRSLPDGTRDEVTVDEYGHAVLVQRVGVLTLDGSESWYLSGGNLRVYTQVINGLCPRYYGDDVAPLLCDKFERKTGNQTVRGIVGVSFQNDLQFAQTGATMTVEDWKTWLASNPTTVLYPLATPVTHDLGYVAAVPLCGPDLTAQAIPSAPFALTYERDLNATLARLESAIATLA